MDAQHKTVTFSAQPHVSFIQSPSKSQSQPRMENLVLESFTDGDITDAILNEAARLFSENYGIWGKDSARPGKPVKLSGRRLKEQWLPESGKNFYVKVTVGGQLAGNVFACRWLCDGKNICWITQLVVSKDYRQRGLARTLLTFLRNQEVDIFGIISSHPAACLAAASSFAGNIEKVSLDYVRKNATAVMESSPIAYIKNAELSGSLFDTTASDGMVSGVNTHFLVDHEEPLEALRQVREDWQWPLGELLDGHEYLLILPARVHRSRSRSFSRK
ncbi:hypothetical protein JX265_014036 [Neoarthrinium moseri]|uniref:N-acetyltransferase domain-containing protein n=1 Tax=Neoarthrinium moseri TaxID=1658444 RepID=A0A9P9W7F5_9PEZI|nr:hypothetical protein JX266_013730 [Neoarthrinium moseri]KAI1846580.1 hypothetical protein JX265_014036 [Neoarthrinium moseri]